MVFAVDSGVTPPVVTAGMMPRRGVGNRGDESAIFDFTVDEHGALTNIRPIHGTKSESDLLATYLVSWKFTPAKKNGLPAAAQGRVLFIKGIGDETSKQGIAPPGSPQPNGPVQRPQTQAANTSIPRATHGAYADRR